MSEAIVQQDDTRIYYNTLKRVGLQGGYQNNLIRIIFTLTVLSASTFFVVPFLFYQDAYVCPDFEGDCNAMVCALPQVNRKAYLPSLLIKSLGNYYGDMHCQSMGKVTQFQQMFLIGTSFGLFASLLFIQFIGKKNLVSLSLALISISLAIILFAQASIAKSIGLFVWGTGSEISFSILTAFITEKTAEKDRLGHYFWLQFWFTVGCLVNCVVFFLFHDWKLVLGCYFLPLYIAVTLAFIFYIESPPLELIARESAENAFAAIMRIAERNEVANHGLTLEEIVGLQDEYKENQKKKHNYTLNFFDLFKYGSVRGDFLKLSLMMFIFFFLLYGPSFVLDQLNMNIFVLTLINVASQFITFPAYAHLIETPRRTTQIKIYTAATVFSFLVFALASDDCFKCNQGWKLAFTLLFFFISRILINLAGELIQASLNESFPAQIRSFGIYGVIAMARLSSIIIPYLIKLKEASGIPLLLQFAFMTLLAIVPAFLIRETYQILPPELIKELQFEHRAKDSEQ